VHNNIGTWTAPAFKKRKINLFKECLGNIIRGESVAKVLLPLITKAKAGAEKVASFNHWVLACLALSVNDFEFLVKFDLADDFWELLEVLAIHIREDLTQKLNSLRQKAYSSH
jgi:hypothetical protein